MNIEKIRQDTRGLDGKIFLNSAGSSLMPSQVVDRMTAYLGLEESYGGYQVEAMQASEIAAFYTQAARLLNAKEHQMAFAYNATDAFSKALSSVRFKQGDYILTSNDDYVSNQIAFLSLQKRFGIQILRANNLGNGDLDLGHFESFLKTHRPALVSLTHIPTNSGKIQDAESVGKLCKLYDTLYLLDACQSVGQIPVDVQKIGCDFLSATGRKFLRGPRGTGLLYVSDKVLDMGLEPLLPDMRGAEWIDKDNYLAVPGAKRFELFEVSYASLLGLTEAIRYANDTGMENIYMYNQELADYTRQKLTAIPGLSLLDMGSRLSNIITFHIHGARLESIEKDLSDAQVTYSVSRRRNAVIDMDRKGIDWALRFSPHYFNTVNELEAAIAKVSDISSQQRNA